MSNQDTAFEIKRWRVSDLKDWPENPMLHTEQELQDLENSLRSIGNANPATVNSDGVILGGHARKIIYLRLGWEFVDCWTAKELIPEERIPEYNIRLNKNVSREFNFELLANNYEITELKNWGFTDYDLKIAPVTGNPEGKLYDEEIAEGVELCKCERCGHQHARRG